jgi:hypothetical protein
MDFSDDSEWTFGVIVTGWMRGRYRFLRSLQGTKREV